MGFLDEGLALVTDEEYAFVSSSLQVVVGSLTRDRHKIFQVGFIHRYMFNSQDKLLGKGGRGQKLGKQSHKRDMKFKE